MEALSIQVDEKVKKLLREKARKHKRSMSKQAAYYIEQGIKEAQAEKDKVNA